MNALPFGDTEGFCHEACAADCNECVRARSESVGAEWEPETPPRPSRVSRIFWYVVDQLGFAAGVAVILCLFMLAAQWDA